MIKLENTKVTGWEASIRGMRNPMNSWEKSDSYFHEYIEWDAYGHDILGNEKCITTTEIDGRPKDEDMIADHGILIGPNDLDLMKRLVAGDSVHAKFRRMLVVTVDITAPLYWWKEFDTYKVGTVANSCSTMHKIQAKEFVPEDFSHEHLISEFHYIWDKDEETITDEHLDKYCLLDPVEHEGSPSSPFYNGESTPYDILEFTIMMLNRARELYLKTGDKKYWWQMIQLLPSSYNQKRTVLLNYEVLAGLYPMRKDHKLDEWHDFCHWVEKLPYAKEIVIGGE